MKSRNFLEDSSRSKIIEKHLVKATPEITLQAFTVDAPANGNATNGNSGNEREMKIIHVAH